MSVKTLERCFNKRIDWERSHIVGTVADRIQNAVLTAIDSIVAPKVELASKSINASSGQDATSVTAISERGEHIGIDAFLENASGNSNALHVSNVNDETPSHISDKIAELSIPETHFDRKTHIYHMVTGQTTQTNQILDFFIGRILTPRNPPSPQHQNLSTQVSENNNLPMVEQSAGIQNSDTNISNNRVANAVARLATQQGSQAATMLKPVSTNPVFFYGKS